MSAAPVAKFHVLLRGAAWLSAGDIAPVSLHAGDLVLLPHGDGHIIADQSGSRVWHLAAILTEHPVDPAGREASFLQGFRRAFGRPPGQYRHEQLSARILNH